MKTNKTNKTYKKYKKYESLKGRAIIESTYGCYTESGWCYVTSKANFVTALNWISGLKFPEQYRVVDSS